jgi:hypothetical protein
MSNPDNIAKVLEQAQQKAATQESTEVTKVDTAAQTAIIDKVAAVAADQNTPKEEEGLTGAARDVAPVQQTQTQPPVSGERTLSFGPEVTSAVAAVNAYELAMGRTRAVTTAIIDQQQQALYNSLRIIVKTEDNGDFMGGMEFLFRKFREDTRGAFAGDTVRRRSSYMKQPSGDKALQVYMGFIDLLQVFSDPKGRKALWPRFNKKLALEFAPAGELRQRLETYMGKICS